MSKIPPDAKLVFKGVLFDVYHWQQKMFDGSTQTFEMIKRRPSAIVAPISGDMIYYSFQEQPAKPPFIGLFGGQVEDGETPLECAKRELLEEAGLESKDWEAWFVYNKFGKLDWSIHYFIARDCKKVGEGRPDVGEKIKVCKTDISDFLKNVVTRPEFEERELRHEILGAFNPEKFEEMKKKLLGRE